MEAWAQGWQDSSAFAKAVSESTKDAHTQPQQSCRRATCLPPPLALSAFARLFGQSSPASSAGASDARSILHLFPSLSSSSSAVMHTPTDATATASVSPLVLASERWRFDAQCQLVVWRYLAQTALRWHRDDSDANSLGHTGFPMASDMWWSPSTAPTMHSADICFKFLVPPQVLASACGIWFPFAWLHRRETHTRTQLWQCPTWRVEVLPMHLLFALRVVIRAQVECVATIPTSLAQWADTPSATSSTGSSATQRLSEREFGSHSGAGILILRAWHEFIKTDDPV
jgi:hypothetical protein